MNDTAPSIAGIVLDGYRAMSSSDRLRRMSALTVDLRRLVIARWPSGAVRIARSTFGPATISPGF